MPTARPPRRAPSFRTFAAWTVVVPVVASGVLLFLLFSMAIKRVSQELARSVMTGSAEGVQREVSAYLAGAVKASEEFAGRIERGDLDASDLASWRGSIFARLVADPGIASIAYGDDRGRSVWVLRSPGAGSRLEYGFGVALEGVDAEEKNAVERVLDARGEPAGEAIRVYHYDPRQRPWYTVARTSSVPRWTPVYAWFEGNAAESAIGTGFVRNVSPPGASARGVLVVDITLGALSEFLRKMPVAQQGRLYVIDREGRLIASSHGEVTDAAGERLLFNELSDPLAAPVAEDAMEAATGALREMQGDGRAGGESVQMRAEPIQPFPGIDWELITVLPESAFIADARKVRHRALMVAGAVAVAALALALVVSRRFSRPIIELARTVRRIGEGDFGARLELEGTREFQRLSKSVNSMAAGLAQRLELEQALAVAREVQQALLPKARPEIPGLDVEGRTRYCEETGGDYFDFIDVGAVSRESYMLALGDVMGHGVGAALLMATGRAALRAHACGEENLGALMGRINTLLCESIADNGAGFMTLATLVVSPRSGDVRWASAGHHPAIVYDPAADAFTELEGAGVPLGIMPEARYQQYAREGVLARPGTVLFLGSDGVWETFSPAPPPPGVREQFGRERVKEVLRQHHRQSSREIADRLDAALDAFRSGGRVKDDVTYIIAKSIG